MNPTIDIRWDASQPDRRASPRAEYRRTPPARLDLAGQACAVRDLNSNGLRIEPAPPSRAWSPGQALSGVLYLRTSGPMPVAGRILRVGAMGLVVIPDGTGAWPPPAAIETERNDLQRSQRDRRSEPRISLPVFLPNGTTPSPLRDLSATGLRYVLSPGDPSPATGSAIEGAVRLDPDTVIAIRGKVVRCLAREVAVALDPPGLASDMVDLLRGRIAG
jgi:PilZ domain-containing protein